jgi:hypothetical protein
MSHAGRFQRPRYQFAGPRDPLTSLRAAQRRFTVNDQAPMTSQRISDCRLSIVNCRALRLVDLQDSQGGEQLDRMKSAKTESGPRDCPRTVLAGTVPSAFCLGGRLLSSCLGTGSYW